MKIHDANEDIIKQDKKRKENVSKHQSIESNYHSYETLSQVIQNRYKAEPQGKYTVRLDKELETTLKIFADEKDFTVPQSIRFICEKYFQDKWITRSFFKLDKPFTVAIPIVPYEIEKYIEDEINCMIDLSEDIDSRLEVQTSLMTKDETDYYLAVTFNVGNNYLDIYNEDIESYCFGTIKDHHIGLFDVYLEHLKESVFIRVIFQDKSPISARIISRHEALQNAITTKNGMLEKYIRTLDQANNLKDFNKTMLEKETYIKTLEAQIKTLENEISNLKNKRNTAEPQDLEQTAGIKNAIDDDIDDEVIQSDHPYSMIPPETQKSLSNAMMQIIKLSALYEKTSRDIRNMMLNAGANAQNVKNKDEKSDNENKSDDTNKES